MFGASFRLGFYNDGQVNIFGRPEGVVREGRHPSLAFGFEGEIADAAAIGHSRGVNADAAGECTGQFEGVVPGAFGDEAIAITERGGQRGGGRGPAQRGS